MKKYIFLSFLFLLFLTNVKLPIQAEVVVTNSIDEIELLTSNVESIIDVIDDYIIIQAKSLNGDDQLLIQKHYQIIWEKSELYINHYLDGDLLYLITDKRIHALHLKTEQKTEYLLPFDVVHQLKIKDGYFWLTGSNDGDGVIRKLDSNFKTIVEYKYGGSADEAIIDITWIDNIPYAIGMMEAGGSNSPFANIGTKGDLKIFLMKLKANYKIDDVIYFNHGLGSEEVQDIFFDDNTFHFLIKAQASHHYYQISGELKILRTEKILEGSKVKGVLSPSLAYILAIETDEKLIWRPAGRKDAEKLLETNFVFVKIKDGELVIYTLNDAILNATSISEYHIVQFDDLVFGVNDEEALFFKMEIISYFEILDFTVEKIEPYYLKTMPGEYQISYQAVRENGNILVLDRKLVIKEYANIYQNDFVPIPFVLSFFGKGTLNGERIHSGYTIEQAGDYRLSLIDAGGVEKTIDFEAVVTDYQRGEYYQADYYLAKDDVLNYQIKLDSHDLINEVIIDSKSHPFIQENNLIKIELMSPSEGMRLYHLEKMIDENGSEVLIDEKIRIACLKRVPNIIIEEGLNDALLLNFDIIDPDSSIVEIGIGVYQNQNLIKRYKTYFDNVNIELDVPENGRYNIVIEMKINLGDGKWLTKEIMTHDVTINKSKIEYASITYQKQNNRLVLNIKADDKHFKTNQIKVLTHDLTSKYAVTSNALIKNIAISSSLIIISGTVVVIYLIRRKKAKKTPLS